MSSPAEKIFGTPYTYKHTQLPDNCQQCDNCNQLKTLHNLQVLYIKQMQNNEKSPNTTAERTHSEKQTEKKQIQTTLKITLRQHKFYRLHIIVFINLVL